MGSAALNRANGGLLSVSGVLPSLGFEMGDDTRPRAGREASPRCGPCATRAIAASKAWFEAATQNKGCFGIPVTSDTPAAPRCSPSKAVWRTLPPLDPGTPRGPNRHRAMTDIVDRDKRSEIMSRIRGRDTEPEMIVRRIAHGLDFRFRLHRRDLPGSPDLVFPRHRAVVMVHGCFWHRHPGCKYAYNPKTRVRFWEDKFEGNVVRDRRNETALDELGWRVMVVWECETRDQEAVAERIIGYLREDGSDPGGGRA